MNPANVVARYRALMAGVDATVTLRRPGFGVVADIEVTVSARITAYKPEDQSGDMVEGDRKVILFAADLAGFPLPLQPNLDRLVSGGRVFVIKAIDDETRKIAGVLMAYELRVSGV